jgi:hypothetical protein
MEEETRTEVVYEINFDTDDSCEEESHTLELEGVDLNDTRAIADYYMSKNNLIDPDQLEVEKKEKELRKQIEEIIDDKESLINYLTNLHASIEVIEERIYKLELKETQREETPKVVRKPPSTGISGRGLGSLPIGLF